jgi:hypothetical protein
MLLEYLICGARTYHSNNDQLSMWDWLTKKTLTVPRARSQDERIGLFCEPWVDIVQPWTHVSLDLLVPKYVVEVTDG